MESNILFIGSFEKPKNGHYGGVYFASTHLRDGLKKDGFTVIEMDTTLKDISQTRISKRIPDIIIRQFRFLITIIKHYKATHLFIFLSGGGSYIDKFPSILLAKVLRIKIFIFPRSGHLYSDFKKSHYRWFVNRTLNRADKIICQSAFWREFFISHGVNESKLEVIENWVDNMKLEESQELDFPEYNGGMFKIIYVSRIEKSKGVDDILLLAKKLRGKLDFSINVYGAGSYQMDFLSNIKSNQVDDVVHFKGWLQKDKMMKVINGHHLAIFPSQTEGYPNSLLDYIFAKIPVLASKIPMVKAVGKENMYYYSIENPEDIAENVLDIVAEYTLAMEKAKRIYTEKIVNNRLSNVMTKLNLLVNELPMKQK